jgi:hypothetical protein
MPAIWNGRAKPGETRLPGAILNSEAGPQGEGQDARNQTECICSSAVLRPRISRPPIFKLANEARRPSAQLNKVELGNGRRPTRTGWWAATAVALCSL